MRIETLFCDDVRQEDNGKHILIGVYGGGLVPSALPQMLQLGIYVRAFDLAAGEHVFNLSVTCPDGSSCFDLSDKIKVESEEDHSVFVFNGVPINATEPGNIVVEMGFDAGEMQRAGVLRVVAPRS